MKEGDYIVGIDETDVKWSQHDEVVALIKASGHTLKLKMVTPMATPSHMTKSEKVTKSKPDLLAKF